MIFISLVVWIVKKELVFRGCQFMESHGGVLWYSVKLWYSYVCQPTKKSLPICVYPMRRKNGIPGVWSMKVSVFALYQNVWMDFVIVESYPRIVDIVMLFVFQDSVWYIS